MYVTLALLITSTGFQNCSKVGFNPSTGYLNSQGVLVESKSGQIEVIANHQGPPLDLFFIVDSSASMEVNQSNLAQAFSSIFKSNSASLSNFDTNIYLFSTASTVNPGLLDRIPTVPTPADMSRMPVLGAAGISEFAPIAGNLFGYWMSALGTPSSSQFAAQFNPATVWDYNAQAQGNTAALKLAKKGLLSDADYQASLDRLTTDFQRRLNYLNPRNQTAADHRIYDALTDVSSGLCTVGRIVKHSSDFVNKGDSAAFIIISDDDDRLMVRNGSGNQCLESINNGGTQVTDGYCGNFQNTFSFNTASKLTYQANAKFTYQSGTAVSYQGTSANDTCIISYPTGYPYTATYVTTNTTTDVSYSKCTQYADTVNCVQTAATTQNLNGDFSGSNHGCAANVATQLSSPAPGTLISCTVKTASATNRPSGVDASSDGINCSAATLAKYPSGASCTITGGAALKSQSVDESHGNCSRACADTVGGSNQCVLISSSPKQFSGSINLSVNVPSCTSTCPLASACGNGTIAEYVTSKFNATCGSVSGITATLTVNSALDSAGSPMGLNSQIGGSAVTDSTGKSVCAAEGTVSSCISSLQIGTSTLASAVTPIAQDKVVTVAVPLNVTCSANCADSGGLCPATSGTIGTWLREQRFTCQNSTVSGNQTLNLPFPTSGAGCATKCRSVLGSGCDGKGWGIDSGLTVADYIDQVLKGGQTCVSGSSKFTSPSGAQILSVPSSATSNACNSAANPVFQATGSPHAQSPLTYVAGDATHLASDFQRSILSQLQATFGNTPITAATIAHLASDTQLIGTDISTSYINLVDSINRAYGNSTQVYDIAGNASDYANSLGSISQMIVTTTRNSFVLSLGDGSKLLSVSLKHPNNNTWQPIPSSQWTWSGNSLSLSANAGLQIGDQLLYQYEVPQ